ncbi:MAG: hypothetical protein LBL84_01770 [Candidatus Nomurabacteria bacterium]|jgi:hypothetical protein|nr:hypothetical protein [Candidatus Nomurabacteria bacterium]
MEKIEHKKINMIADYLEEKLCDDGHSRRFFKKIASGVPFSELRSLLEKSLRPEINKPIAYFLYSAKNLCKKYIK